MYLLPRKGEGREGEAAPPDKHSLASPTPTLPVSGRGIVLGAGREGLRPLICRAMSASIITDLPIEPLIPEILGALAAAPNLVLEAPPGAGKTTRVPLALLDAAWAGLAKIIVLEPRRLAARGAAARMAAMLGEEVGETVGYRVRLDRKVGPKTRIEAVTTGLFLRQLQGDPALPGVAAILFDEFHERTIEGDMALAFALEAQAGLREDLRLVVMSATLDGESVAQRIPGARRLRSEGRAFPVETHHLGDDANARLEDRMASAIRRALAEQSGDILAFLPGTAEIRRTQERLSNEDVVLPLYGDLPLPEQDKAIRRDPQGRRKIILATSIAETSLTIDGVRVVVDSGLRRSPRFDPTSGMSRLVTVKASLAAAAQRRGRAGRTEPGVCYRLWSAASERALPAFDAPEIEAADLAPLALELAAWGIADPASLTLMTPPPAAALSQARALLRQLEAIDAGNLATPAWPPHGRARRASAPRPHDGARGGARARRSRLRHRRDLERARSPEGTQQRCRPAPSRAAAARRFQRSGAGPQPARPRPAIGAGLAAAAGREEGGAVLGRAVRPGAGARLSRPAGAAARRCRPVPPQQRPRRHAAAARSAGGRGFPGGGIAGWRRAGSAHFPGGADRSRRDRGGFRRRDRDPRPAGLERARRNRRGEARTAPVVPGAGGEAAQEPAARAGGGGDDRGHPRHGPGGAAVDRQRARVAGAGRVPAACRG